MIEIFHKEITPENKVLIQEVLDLIKPILNDNGYESVGFLQKKRSVDFSGTPKNKVNLYFTKDDIKFTISVQIYD